LLDSPHFSVGDPSAFTNAEFVVGEASKKVLDPETDSFRSNPAYSSITFPQDRMRFITASDLNVEIGPYPLAMDFFGDGSMYIIDASGSYLLHARDQSGFH